MQVDPVALPRVAPAVTNGERHPAVVGARRAAFAALALVATGAVVFGLGPMSAVLAAAPDGTLLDMAPRDAAAVGSWLDGLGEAGRALYAQHLCWDVAFLLVNGLCLFVLLRAPRTPLRVFAWLAPLVAGLDAIENAAAAQLLADHPQPAAELSASLAATWLEPVTAVKLALVPVLFIATATAWAIAAWRRLRR